MVGRDASTAFTLLPMGHSPVAKDFLPFAEQGVFDATVLADLPQQAFLQSLPQGEADANAAPLHFGQLAHLTSPFLQSGQLAHLPEQGVEVPVRAAFFLPLKLHGALPLVFAVSDRPSSVTLADTVEAPFLDPHLESFGHSADADATNAKPATRAVT